MAMELNVGCELGRAAKHNLRLAVATIVSVMALVNAPPSHADASHKNRPDEAHDLAAVVVNAPSFERQIDTTWHDWLVAQFAFDSVRYGAVPEDGYGGGDSGGDGAASNDAGTGRDSSSKCPKSGNPVSLGNANKVEIERDFTSRAIEMPLFFERIYNSNYHEYSIIGSNWASNLDYQLQMVGPNELTVWVVRPDGKRIDLFWGEGNRWVASNPSTYVVRNSDGSYTFHSDELTVERYELVSTPMGGAVGRIVERKNPQGVGWTFVYGNTSAAATRSNIQPTEVIHTSGQRVRLIYSGERLQTVIDPAGNQYRFDVRSETITRPYAVPFTVNILDRVTYPDGQTTTYHYPQEVGSSELLGKSINGQRYSWFGWASQVDPSTGMNRRLPISTEHANGVEKYRFDYTMDTKGAINQVVETNPLGKQATYKFAAGKLLQVVGHASANCGGAVSSISYDGHGNQDVVTAYDGISVDYDYDAHGHLLKRVEGANTGVARTTTYEWDESRNRVARETVSGARQAAYAYTGDGFVDSVSVTSLNVAATARGTKYTYTRHGNGLLASMTVDGPIAGATDAVTTTFGPAGELLSTTNGAGHIVRYSGHNALGLPSRKIDAGGAITDYGYDSRGRIVLERTYPSGSAVDKRYIYGSSGLLEEVQHADGNRALYHYDAARRLIQEDLTSPDGGFDVKRYTYNAMSQPIRIETGRDN